MSPLRLATLAAALSAAILAACTRKGDSTPASAAAALPDGSRSSAAPAVSSPASDAVADVNGAQILAADLERKVGSRLARLRQEEYDIRRQALDELIAERLLDAEASKRGLSREELLRREVEARAAQASTAEVERIYGENKDRFTGQSLAEAYGRIRELLGERAQAERRVAYQRELRQAARVVTRLAVPRSEVSVPTGAPATGPASAPVTIVEFTDYQCPYCHRAQVVMDEVLSRYKERVRLVHLDFPLQGHPGATPAARAARCAGEQEKFWEYHRSLMTAPGTLDDADLRGRATALQLDPRVFETCLASSRHDAAIEASFRQGEELGVTGTPAYFINGRMVSGARPLADFTEVIDAELGGR